MTDDERREARNVFVREDRELLQRFSDWWVAEMSAGAQPLREHMTLFWHGHFTSSHREVRDAEALIRQNQLFREHALGNFGTLLRAVLRDPAMLVYLDNDQNTKESPNENLARELFELFTLGEGHYTEGDVHEAARALTGWDVRFPEGAVFMRGQHDRGQKSVLGTSAELDGDGLVDLILAREECARWIAGRILHYFEGREPDPERLERYAEFLRESDYELEPLLRALFVDPDFYAAEVVGTRISGPIEYLVGASRRLGLEPPSRLVWIAAGQLGQRLFEPPSVKGWEGGRAWIGTSSLLQRGNAIGLFLGVVSVDQVLAREAGLDEGVMMAQSMERRRGRRRGRHGRGPRRDRRRFDGHPEAHAGARARRDAQGARREALLAGHQPHGALPGGRSAHRPRDRGTPLRRAPGRRGQRRFARGPRGLPRRRARRAPPEQRLAARGRSGGRARAAAPRAPGALASGGPAPLMNEPINNPANTEVRLGARAIDRRELLACGALGALAWPLGAGAGRAGAPPANGRTLVLVQLSGGNDGLSTVVPYADDLYRGARPELGIAQGDVHVLDDYRGLHRGLERLFATWKAGKLAIVEGVGYPDASRSHFASMDVWHAGDPRGRKTGEGWVGRLVARGLEAPVDPNLVIHVGTEVPYALHSRTHPPASFALPQSYRWVGGEAEVAAYAQAVEEAATADEGSDSSLAYLRSMLRSAQGSSERVRRAAADYRTDVEYPPTPLGMALRNVAALIAAEIGTRVFSVELASFDTHTNQRSDHDSLMRTLDGALGAFLEDLAQSEVGRSTVVLAYSEFGRRVKENGTGGTDHGLAGPVLARGRRRARRALRRPAVAGRARRRRPGAHDGLPARLRHADRALVRRGLRGRAGGGLRAARLPLIRSQDQTHQIPRNWDPA